MQKTKAVSPLLRKVLSRSQTTTMASKDLSVFVNILIHQYIVLCPDHDTQQASNLIVILREIHGEPFNNDIKLRGSDLTIIRCMISGVMPSFIKTVQMELPAYEEKIRAIDWRSLFGIVENSVEEKVTSPSSDNSPNIDCGTDSLDSAKREFPNFE